MPALVYFIPLVGFRMFFQFGGSVKAFFTHVALVRKVFSVYRDYVAFQVTGIGAFVFTMRTLVSLMTLEYLSVPL